MLCGCAMLDANRDFLRAQSESNPAGVKGLLRGNELRFLNTADLVRSFVPSEVPEAVGATKTVKSSRDIAAKASRPAGGVATAQSREEEYRARLEQEQRETDQAVAAFYSYYLTGSGDKARIGALLRNEIQDRILAAANQRCHLWKNYYSTASSTIGFSSGIVAATTGAAAVAFTPESTKNALTALSTTATAVGTNYDKAYLFGLTLGVIYQGVDSRRANILKSILAKRVVNNDVASLGNYTLSAGIEDALEYHGACSVASGAQEAAERIADARTASATAEKKEPATSGSSGKSDAGAQGAGGKDAAGESEAGKTGASETMVTVPARTASPASVAAPAIPNNANITMQAPTEPNTNEPAEPRVK